MFLINERGGSAMKTKYSMPDLNIEQIEKADVLTASAETDNRDNIYSSIDSFNNFDSSGFDMSSFL